MLQNITQKREKFIIGLKKKAREETFRKNRFPQSKDIIPFTCSNNIFQQSYYEAFEKGNQQKFNSMNDEYDMDETITDSIFKVQQLSNYYNEYDCEPDYNTTNDVERIFKIFNIGYPQIDKSCLHILLAISAGNHQQIQPIHEYIQQLAGYYNSTYYTELQQYILDIFANLACDCYQCRDLILILQLPKCLWNYTLKCKQKCLFDDFYSLIINLDRMKPEINKFKLIELHEILQDLYIQLYNAKEKQWILKMMNRIYSYDKSKLDLSFLNYLLKGDFENIQLCGEIFKYFQYVSLLDNEITLNFQSQMAHTIIKTIKNFMDQQNIIKRELKSLIKKGFVTLSNFITDDPQYINEFWEEILPYAQNIPSIFLEVDDFFLFLHNLIKFSKDEDVIKLNKDYKLIKQIAQELNDYCEEKDNQFLFNILFILYRLISIDQVNVKIFNEEDCESRILFVQQMKISDENYELINLILDKLDQ
ncbi:unnamed protein product [Paramecium pentaurelia]|uniref:Uncharacterized protein n=1 Tax=Paramecium pentaurelia TaxID=43138 RepID=A0A8S1TK42_9CILI|nr:unnamed protein product [Paramecium pentaurelia]